MTKHTDEIEVTNAIAIWQQTIATQMHFNEMSVKSRQLGLTYITAILGVSAVALANSPDAALPVLLFRLSFNVHVAVLLIVVAVIGLKGVQTLDLNVYHKMLRGAVTFGEDFERNNLNANVFKLNSGMTQTISHFSRFDDASVSSDEGKPNVYRGSKRSTALDKIEGFYKMLTFSLIGTTIIVFWMTGDFEIVPV